MIRKQKAALLTRVMEGQETIADVKRLSDTTIAVSVWNRNKDGHWDDDEGHILTGEEAEKGDHFIDDNPRINVFIIEPTGSEDE